MLNDGSGIQNPFVMNFDEAGLSEKGVILRNAQELDGYRELLDPLMGSSVLLIKIHDVDKQSTRF